MRILHISNHCRKGNGNVNVSIDIACTQARMGHVVGYASSGGDFQPLLEERGVFVFDVPEPHHGFLPVAFPKAVAALWRAVLKFRPDIVHLHMAVHNIALQPLRLMGLKTVTTVHNEFDKTVWLMGLADRVISVSKAGALAMQARGVSPDRSRVIINGSVNSPRLPASFKPLELAHPAITTVCGLHPRKGVADLLNAFSSLKSEFESAHLYIVGDGPMRDEYETLSNALEIDDRVSFVGFVSDPRPYLFGSDIFVLASHADPGPLVIAEARQAGNAVIATNVDGIPEMLDHGLAGILIPPKDTVALADALRSLLHAPDELKNWRARARAGADRFTTDRVCRDLDAIYSELTTRREAQ